MSWSLTMCARHGINLTGESPVTGISAKCSEPQVEIFIPLFNCVKRFYKCSYKLVEANNSINF